MNAVIPIMPIDTHQYATETYGENYQVNNKIFININLFS